MICMQDIAFLAHEPLLDKFREQKAFLKKIRRATGRHEKKIAMRLDKRRPTYRLDHLIRERYPTFDDALRDLDDALCLVHLFASISSSKLCPPARVHACHKLSREFQAYVVRTHALRKVFISIKGFYYQAEILGVLVTWVTPHTFAQQPTMSVDYRVMLSFLELYETIMRFVNFRLFHTLKLDYPPPLDEKQDAAGAHLSAMLLKCAAAETPQLPALALPAPSEPDIATAPLDATQLDSLNEKLEKFEGDKAAVDAAEALMAPSDAMGEYDDTTQMIQDDGDTQSAESRLIGSLFNGCIFFCGRETPIASLELLVLACGGSFGWEGKGSLLNRSDEVITHQVIDRPLVGDQLPNREYVQPQWLYDCLNARALLPTHPYAPGKHCPPHLSPFLDGHEGYTPVERIRQAIEAAAAQSESSGGGEVSALEEARAAAGRESGGRSDDDEGGSDDDEGGSDDESDVEESDESHEEKLDSEEEAAAEYARELKTEALGRSYNEAAESGGARKRKDKEATATTKREEEAKELAKMMMSRKKRRLYDRMQHGIRKKAAASQVLQQKRKAIDAKGKGAKKGRKA